MTKAVITLSGQQHLVQKGDVLDVDHVSETSLKCTPLLIVDDKKTYVGTPEVKNAVVTLKALETLKDKKVTSIRYKSKKRVKTIKGHRQTITKLEVTDIKTT